MTTDTGPTSEERQRDWTVEIGKQPDRSGPEPLKFSPQLVRHRDPRNHQILTRASQRTQRLGLIRVWLQW